jgi:hypothetical protein
MERETMLSGTPEPECRDHPPEVVPAVRTSVSGADAPSQTLMTSQRSGHDAPSTEATKTITHATIYPSVNGMATAGCAAGSTAVI